MNSTWIRRASAVAALGMVAVGLAAGPAAASPPTVVIDNDPAKIAVHLGKADFGQGLHLLGEPTQSGNVRWAMDNDGMKTVTLTGRVYWDDLTSGGCARVRVTLHRPDGNRIGGPVNSATACRNGSSTGGAPPSKAVNISFTAKNAYRLKVIAQTGVFPGAGWHSETTRNYYLGGA